MHSIDCSSTVKNLGFTLPLNILYSQPLIAELSHTIINSVGELEGLLVCTDSQAILNQIDSVITPHWAIYSLRGISLLAAIVRHCKS